jgi:hypothetical protein
MVIDARTALPLCANRRQSADIAPIAVCKQQGDIIGHAHALIEIILHFFIQGPDLRSVFSRCAGDLRDDIALIGDDGFKQSDRGALLHRFIAVTAHPYGHNPVSAV